MVTRSTTVAVPAPGQRLAPRPPTYGRDSASLMGFGLAAAGGLQLAGMGWATLPTATAGIVLATMTIVSGRRAAARDRLRDLLVESLAPFITVGRDMDRRMVRLVGRGLPPAQVHVRYAPAVADDHPNWLSSISGVLSRRLEIPVRLERHDRRRCLLVFVQDSEAASRSPEQERIDRSLKAMIGASARITGFEVTAAGEVSRITVSHSEPAKCAVDGFRNRAQTTIGKMLAGRWRAHWDLVGDSVVFEQRPQMPEEVWLPESAIEDVSDLVQRNYRELQVRIGVTEDGAEATWRPALSPHLLATGTTGSGKTELVYNLIGSATAWKWPVWILDGKQIEFRHHRTWPNVQIVASEVPEQVAFVRRVHQVVRRRFKLIEQGLVRVEDLEPMLAVFDEFSEFVSSLLDWYSDVKGKGDPARPATLREFASIVRTARVVRVHLVITMQRCDVALFGDRTGGEVRSNIQQRISMGRLDLQAAMMMWGDPRIGVTVPRQRPGRATAVDEKGNPAETQCYRFPAMDAEKGTAQHALLQRLRPKEARHPRLLVVPPEEEKDLDTSEELQLRFEDYANATWVKADERPDLDPVRIAEKLRNDDPDLARKLGSPLALLGLDPDVPKGAYPAMTIPRSGGGEEASDWSPAIDELIDDFGYDEPQDVESPYALEIGDLVLLEAEPGGKETWVTVDELPEEDPSDPMQVLVSWRDDSDSSGVLLLAADQPVTTRKAVGWDRDTISGGVGDVDDE